MITTTAIKYLGSKASFLTDIQKATTELGFAREHTTVLDAFSGSTRVAQMYRQQGFHTITAELLPACTSYSNTFITNPSAQRNDLSDIIDMLNDVTPVEGWLTQYYGEAPPTEDKGAGKLVNAFTKANAMKADAIRDIIERLKPEVTTWEYHTLITSLILGLNAVQNSQGHQRAFFRDFQKSALNPLVLTLPPLVGDPTLTYATDDEFVTAHPVGAHFHGDVLSDACANTSKTPNDLLVYIDPPYTTNLPYNQFYHLWDSIVLWDKPNTVGSTNRREDRQSKREGGPACASSFTKRQEAEQAFTTLYQQYAHAKGLLISYSSDSIVPYNRMCELIEDAGFTVHDVNHKEYNRHALSKSGTASEETKKTAKKTNTEWLFKATK